MKRLLILLLLTGATWAAGALSTLEGRFVTVEVGDYVHLYVTDDKGVKRHFYVFGIPDFEKFMNSPEKFKDKRVRVTWHTVVRDLPEAGGKVTLNEATSVKLVP